MMVPPLRKKSDDEYFHYNVDKTLQVSILPKGAQWTMDGIVQGYLSKSHRLSIQLQCYVGVRG